MSPPAPGGTVRNCNAATLVLAARARRNFDVNIRPWRNPATPRRKKTQS